MSSKHPWDLEPGDKLKADGRIVKQSGNPDFRNLKFVRFTDGSLEEYAMNAPKVEVED